MSIIPALEVLRQKDHEFEATLPGYIALAVSKQNKRK
jgi:hypothetical protein